MKIDGADIINTNIGISNSTGSNANSKNVGDLDTVRKPQQTVKAISQINEFEMNNMPVSEKVVIEAIQKANKAISGGNRRFEFSIHEKTNEIVVKVYDSDTNELVREIPNEKVLDMVAKICEMAGILVDERR
ncbi:flagellar protein FlaG [Ruminiclostridium cellobioparum]|uniref:Putative flagellar protein FlaG n=1 Tax=Ruminiclostridium cellobioparum subsp. termitidis CT1112 TaxID=1195236 RepID=S0FPK3_RUMCE|nr:flagellar protein FlaG [Ruminiclostridium cellobioparum]EMS70388.1 putative flagellar protein FlaG [Ruminiclostridium cellobioparum subsp. termitidis CT1112]